MTQPAAVAVGSRPLHPEAARGTITLLDRVTCVLESYVSGRTPTGADAVLIREACRRLGSVLAQIAKVSES